MQIEYACYDIALNEEDIKQNIVSAVKYNPYSISIHPYCLPTIKGLIPNTIKVSCAVDYPLGLNDTSTRNNIIKQLVKSSQVDIIDLHIPSKIIVNRKYDKFREDIKINSELCKNNNIQLRYILEYRIFSHEILAKLCQILKTFGIEYVLPASGFFIDDINDNIIAAKYLMAKSEINVICNGNVWTKQHVENTLKSGVHGLRVSYLPALDLATKNNNF